MSDSLAQFRRVLEASSEPPGWVKRSLRLDSIAVRPPAGGRMGRQADGSNWASPASLLRGPLIAAPGMTSTPRQRLSQERISTNKEQTMGKLIVTEFVTLDGVAQAPGGPDEDRDGGFAHGGWQAPVADQKSGEVIFEQARSMDAPCSSGAGPTRSLPTTG